MKLIKNHILFVTMKNLNPNSRISILTEPLWFIPYSIFVPFQSLYMRQLGLSTGEIGFVLGISMFLQVFLSLAGGIITDKFGRRKTTFFADILAWTVPCLIWAFSQNFWWFVVGAVINSLVSVSHVSWTCLFVEDCQPRYVRTAFLLIQICGMLSVFFSPISILLVANYGVVPAVRAIYIFSAISMFMKFVILFRFGNETQLGLRRLEETKNVSFREMLAGYKGVIRKVFTSKQMLFVVGFITIFQICAIPTTSFFALYVTETLDISDELVGFFPILRTLLMLLFVLQLQNVVHRLTMWQGALIGSALYITSHIVLIFGSAGSLIPIIIYTLLEASAYSFIAPRKDELMVLYVDEQNRSRIYAVYTAAMIGFSAPFGAVFGWLYDYDTRLPFIINITLFTLAAIMVGCSKHLRKHEETYV